MRIAVDIGGVMSRYSSIFRPLVEVLLADKSGSVEVFVISDIKPREKAIAMCYDNNFLVKPENLYQADYEQYGDECKAVLCEQLGIDMLIDDFPGYVAMPGKPPVRLLVMPDASRDYYDESWKTDGSEGNFGRRRHPQKKDHGL